MCYFVKPQSFKGIFQYLWLYYLCNNYITFILYNLEEGGKTMYSNTNLSTNDLSRFRTLHGTYKLDFFFFQIQLNIRI